MTNNVSNGNAMLNLASETLGRASSFVNAKLNSSLHNLNHEVSNGISECFVPGRIPPTLVKPGRLLLGIIMGLGGTVAAVAGFNKLFDVNREQGPVMGAIRNIDGLFEMIFGIATGGSGLYMAGSGYFYDPTPAGQYRS